MQIIFKGKIRIGEVDPDNQQDNMYKDNLNLVRHVSKDTFTCYFKVLVVTKCARMRIGSKFIYTYYNVYLF